VPQIYGRDLRPGDILLEWNAGAAIHQAIAFGQKLMNRGTGDLIHAGIYFENRFLIESDGSGISAADMFVQNRPYSYTVYRPANQMLGAGAATAAKVFMDIHARTGGMPYTVSGAVASIFKKPGTAPSRDQMDVLFDKLIKGKNHPFFCSQFVVFVYQFVAEQNNIPAAKILNYGDGCVPPSLLGSTLKSHPMFSEPGYLLANER
jgi:hypothetical protein